MTGQRNMSEMARLEMTMQRLVLQALAEGPLTVVEVAEEMGQPADQVLVWMMGMRRYGLLAESEDPNDDDYYTYSITPAGQEVPR